MKLTRCILIGILLLTASSFNRKTEWENLLDKDLSKWGKYLSYRHKDGYNGDMPKDESGQDIIPIGYDTDPTGVFTVSMVNHQPVLRVSGEIYGCVFTKQSFENYHLKLQVKWGEKKWVPRLNEPKDSGIIYHSQGEAGVDYWRAWMLGQEFQIMEGGFGDYWNIATAQCNIKTIKPVNKKDTIVYSIQGNDTPVGAGSKFGGFVQQGSNYEKPGGEWNTVELICFGDKSIHIVNGHVVMAISKSRYASGDTTHPLVKGKIQLQSEAAETFYKNILIKPIDQVPAKYIKYFQ